MYLALPPLFLSGGPEFVLQSSAGHVCKRGNILANSALDPRGSESASKQTHFFIFSPTIVL